MALRFASSLGEVHSATTDVTQLLRYFGGQSAMGAGLGGGLMSNTAMVDGSAFLISPVFTEQNTWIVQGAFLAAGDMAGGSTQNAGFRFYRQGLEQLKMQFVPAGASGARQDGQLYECQIIRGATTIASTGFLFYSRQWNVFQLEVTIDTLGGGTGAFELRAATVTNATVGPFVVVASGSGINTADQAVEGCDQVYLDYQVENNGGRWDHFFVFDDTGANNNDFPGGATSRFILVHGVVPNAQGAQNDWTSQGGQGNGATDYESVNDPGGNTADDVGRHTSQVVDDIFIVGFQTPGETGTPGNEAGPTISSQANVLGVIFHHVSGMENSGNRTVRPIYRRIDDVRSEGGDVVLNDTTLNGFFEVFELEPIGAVAWTVQQMLEMQWGLKLQA